MGLFTDLQSSFKSKIGRTQVTQQAVLSALSSVQDPDLGKDIVSLGFVKDVAIDNSSVRVTVELTTPACPVKEELRNQCITAIGNITGVEQIQVHMTAAEPPKAAATSAAPKTGLDGVRNIIAVASGKGGVGKSTVSVNLAYTLARMGARVGILDADVYGPSLRQMTNVGQPPSMDGNLVVPPEVSGVKIMTSAMFIGPDKAAALRGPMASQLVRQFLQQTNWGNLDYLIIDYPPGTGDIQITLSQQATIAGAIVVTTPQELALLDAKKAMKMFEITHVPIIGIVETMSYFICDGCTKKHPIFREGGGQRLADQFGVPLLGQLPMDPAVAVAGDAGDPLALASSESASKLCFDEIAANTARQLAIMTHNNDNVRNSFRIQWQ